MFLLSDVSFSASLRTDRIQVNITQIIKRLSPHFRLKNESSQAPVLLACPRSLWRSRFFSSMWTDGPRPGCMRGGSVVSSSPAGPWRANAYTNFKAITVCPHEYLNFAQCTYVYGWKSLEDNRAAFLFYDAWKLCLWDSKFYPFILHSQPISSFLRNNHNHSVNCCWFLDWICQGMFLFKHLKEKVKKN